MVLDTVSLVFVARVLVLVIGLSVGSVLLGFAIVSSGERTALEPTTTIDVVSDNDRVASLQVVVADSLLEQYVGLGGTSSLGPDEGMLFVFSRERTRVFGLRGMVFPIDIVFVDSNGTITQIHHADLSSNRLFHVYRGRAKYVAETPYDWTREHGVEVGDRVQLDDAQT